MQSTELIFTANARASDLADAYSSAPGKVPEAFERLADRVRREWRRADFTGAALPPVATDALERCEEIHALDADDLLRWALRTDRLPRQIDIDSRFSNFALTMVSDERFYIEVLFWTDGSTAIHQHGFSGAFYVLDGSSIHTRWQFAPERRWGDHLKAGSLRAERSEWLRKGATRPIIAGSQFVHSLFHLEAPSVTVVVRDHSSASREPQFMYERSGLAFDPFARRERAEKLVQAIGILWDVDESGREAKAAEALRESDAWTFWRVMSVIGPRLDAPTRDRLLERVEYGDLGLANLVAQTISQRTATRALLDRRRASTHYEHRLLLALALNLPDRKHIDALLSEMYPSSAPTDLLTRWITSMSRTPHRQDTQKTVLGFELNDVSERVIALLLAGYTTDQVIAAIGTDANAECEADLRSLCDLFRGSNLLGSLMRFPQN